MYFFRASLLFLVTFISTTSVYAANSSAKKITIDPALIVRASLAGVPQSKRSHVLRRAVNRFYPPTPQTLPSIPDELWQNIEEWVGNTSYNLSIDNHKNFDTILYNEKQNTLLALSKPKNESKELCANSLHLCNVRNGALVHTLIHPEFTKSRYDDTPTNERFTIDLVAQSPDGTYIATTTRPIPHDSADYRSDSTTNSRLHLWNSARQSSEIYSAPDITALAISNDSKKLAAACSPYNSQIWDMKDIRSPIAHYMCVPPANALHFSQSGNMLIAQAKNNDIYIYDAHTGKTLHCIPQARVQSGAVEDLVTYTTASEISPDNRRVFITSKVKDEFVYNLRTTNSCMIETCALDGSDRHTLTHQPMTMACMNPKNGDILSSHNNLLYLWKAGIDYKDSDQKNDAIVLPKKITAMNFSHDGSLIATCSRSKMVQLWDALTLRLLGTMSTSLRHPVAVEVTPNNKGIITRNALGRVHITLKPEDLKEIFNIPQKFSQKSSIIK
jgi:WD40 repeat protein